MSDTQQPVNPPLPSPPTASKESPDFLIQEYNALRGEVLKRTEIQHQLVSLSLIGSGTFLTIGLKDLKSPTVVLAYPILAMLLNVLWYQSNVFIEQIGTYIRKHIEGRLLGASGVGWEGYLYERRRGKQRWPLSLFSAGSIFVGTEIVAVLLVLLTTGWPELFSDKVLVVVDLAIIACTTVLILRYCDDKDHHDRHA
jgi:hypothetical protein